MTDTPQLDVAIIGAGIAGLAAAIGLKDHPGINVQIYERTAELREIGASIALGPNGMRTLERLGVHNALEDAVAFRNKSGHPMIYRHWKTNEVVSVDSHLGPVDYRHQTSRFYRAHLQQALAKHVDRSRIHLAKAFQSVKFDEPSQRLLITFTDGTTAKADILLGADGIHSPVRTFFVPTAKTAWTGWVTFRSVFPRSPHLAHIPDLPDEANHFWGAERSLFLSPLGRDLYTVVGSYQSDPGAADAPWKESTWNADGDVDVLRTYYRDWSPLVRSIIDATPHTRIYPNVACADGLQTWVLGDRESVTLAGDAAHAHGGAFAAGGSLALDDAWAFAAAIRHVFPETSASKPNPQQVSRALRIYERTRKAHTDRVIRVVHEGNAKKLAAVLTAAAGAPETDAQLRVRMLNRYDPTWIHEHDVVATFAQVLKEDEDEGAGAGAGAATTPAPGPAEQAKL